jgi:hypothetical protein
MVTEGRGGQVDVTLDLARRRAIRSGLHDEPEDSEADRVPERAELVGVSF